MVDVGWAQQQQKYCRSIVVEHNNKYRSIVKELYCRMRTISRTEVLSKYYRLSSSNNKNGSIVEVLSKYYIVGWGQYQEQKYCRSIAGWAHQKKKNCLTVGWTQQELKYCRSIVGWAQAITRMEVLSKYYIVGWGQYQEQKYCRSIVGWHTKKRRIV